MTRRAALAAALLVIGAGPVCAQTPGRPAAPQPAASTPRPVAGPEAAFGAYQRGHYLTAFRLATERVEAEADPVSMTLLAELHAGGLGVPMNEQRALGWYRLAADRGDRNAIFALGMLHIDGRAGQERDPAKARPLFEQAAALGHAAAAYNLGLLALTGSAGGDADPVLAARWFQAAADLGNADAMYALGVLFKEGRGVATDLARAAGLLEAAAAQDLPEAQIEFAVMLFNGQGVNRDEARAAQLFRRAALRGNPVAMNRYARLLAVGRGVAADPRMAAQWHTLARLMGAQDDWLHNFVQRMDPVLRDQAERAAQAWFR